MGMLISGIVSFSLGVEKGKRLAQARSSPSRATYVPPAAVKNAIIEEERVVPPAQATIITASGYYTIQLASYKSSACAKREAEALKRKGLAPIILKKGNYIVLCVGNFPSKETARSLMPQLAPRYRGCYIRRL
jgi:septal ring-binding cell division protein DamX